MQRPRWFVLNIMSYCWVNGEERIGATGMTTHRPHPTALAPIAHAMWRYVFGLPCTTRYVILPPIPCLHSSALVQTSFQTPNTQHGHTRGASPSSTCRLLYARHTSPRNTFRHTACSIWLGQAAHEPPGIRVPRRFMPDILACRQVWQSCDASPARVACIHAALPATWRWRWRWRRPHRSHSCPPPCHRVCDDPEGLT
jgi:hypothetical protein